MTDRDDITTETLKELINAPEPGQPLVASDAFETEETQSARPIWKLPLPRLVLAGVALVPLFAIASYFIIDKQRSEEPQQTQQLPQPEEAPPATDDGAVEEAEQLRQENAELKAESALDGQEQLLAQQTSQDAPAEVSPEAAEDALESVPEPTPPPEPPPATTVSQSSPPPRIQASPPPQPVPVSSRPSQNPKLDPVQQWHQLAKLGSYGAIAPPETAAAETAMAATTTTEPVVPTQVMAEPEILVASVEPVPVAQVAPTSAVKASTVDLPESDSNTNPDSPVSLPEVFGPEISEQSLSEVPPPILYEAEAAILEGQPRMQSLIAGASASGELSTPVMLEQANQGDRFLVRLHEPLMDNRGQIAVPAESDLLVVVDAVSEEGMVQLSAVGMSWAETEGQRELILPPGVVQIRGENGEPLMAERFDDPGGAIAGMDAGQFVLGAVRRTAELYTRSDTRVQTGDGTTVVTEDNPEPNIVAGVLEGGTDAILDTITERNSRAIAQMESRSPIWFIEAGTPIQVFVNRSMQLPR